MKFYLLSLSVSARNQKRSDDRGGSLRLAQFLPQTLLVCLHSSVGLVKIAILCYITVIWNTLHFAVPVTMLYVKYFFFCPSNKLFSNPGTSWKQAVKSNLETWISFFQDFLSLKWRKLIYSVVTGSLNLQLMPSRFKPSRKEKKKRKKQELECGWMN